MKFELTILGSGSALPTSNRFGTAHVLNVHERFYLIDCAEGCQSQLRRFKIPIGKIHHIFISHLHGDHYYGLFGLLSTLQLMGRKTPLTLYAPVKIEDMIKSLSHVSESLSYPLVIKPHSYDGLRLIADEKGCQVFSFPLNHKVPTVGFLFREKRGQRVIIKDKIKGLDLGIKDLHSLKNGKNITTKDGFVIDHRDLTKEPLPSRSYAFCSDTQYFEEIVPSIKNIDLLYHEASYSSHHQKRAYETMHSTAREAAIVAQKAEAGRLIIGHFSARYKDLTILLEEARGVFPETELAYDGMISEL